MALQNIGTFIWFDKLGLYVVMQKTCNTCGLPDELCVCEDVSKQDQKIEITLEDRQYGKVMTVASGFDPDKIDVDALSSELKSNFACGGTTSIQDNTCEIQLQGDHIDSLSEYLEEEGYELLE